VAPGAEDPDQAPGETTGDLRRKVTPVEPTDLVEAVGLYDARDEFIRARLDARARLLLGPFGTQLERGFRAGGERA